MLKIRALLLLLVATASGAQDAPAPLTATTDPARAQVVLPEPAKPGLPSLILIGDSTVRNGHDDGQGKGAAGQWGWGNPLAAAFDAGRINVVNRAVGGLSSRTYITSGHWEKTKAFIKRGDTVLIQFGHNDASAINDSSRARGTIKGTGTQSEEIDNQLTGKKETVYSYGAYLRRYVAEIRALGATPILCSLVPRKRWDEQGRVQRSGPNGYAAWAAEVATQENIGFIDLNEQVAQRYEAMGRDAVMKLFPEVTPDESVHTNWAGAALTAQVVVANLKRLKALPDAVYADERPLAAASPVAGPQNKALPTLFIVGDSTVRSNGQGGAWGWGERITPYFDAQRINVVNHAIGGRSSRTFMTEGRWDAVMAQLKAGDFVLIQFGHNDGGRIGDPAMKGRASGPGTGPELVEDIRPDGTREQVRTFGAYMARYVADSKARGAAVVILSPIPHKDRWKDGQRDFENFAAWGAQVAREGGAPFIDLTMLVTEGYRKLGEEPVNAFFSDARTHTNDAGARYNAARVIDGLKALPGAPFAPFLAASPLVFEKGPLLFADDFQDTANWQAEIAPLPDSTVTARDGKLVLDTAGGVTAWFKPRLSGNVLIEYRRKVIMQGGPRDRLSDLNQFWMADKALTSKLDGVFESYDGLTLYYAGIGGNGNTSTRFRKYEGDGRRTVLKEYADAAHLLQPNREVLVQTMVKDGRTAVFVDGQPWFDFQDPKPLSSGHFGLRSTQSRQEVSAFRVYALK